MASTTSAKSTTAEKSTPQKRAVPQRPPLHLPVATLLAYLILTLGAITFVMPFLWMVSTSLMTISEVSRGVLVTQSRLLGVYKANDTELNRPLGEYLIPEAQIQFDGVAISLIYDTDPKGGTFDIYVDGQLVSQVDTHSKQPQASQTILVDGYPNVTALSQNMRVLLPDGKHTLRLLYNESASQGNLVLFRGLSVRKADGTEEFIPASLESFQISVGRWDMQTDAEGTPILKSTNLGFPEYMETCCRSSIERTPSLQRTPQARYIKERQNGGLATLKVNLPFGIYKADYILSGGVSHYVKVWTDENFSEYFINSTIITLMTVVGQTFFSILAAYAFARMNWPGRNLVFSIFLMTLFIPSVVVLIPRLLIVTSISRWSVEHVGPVFESVGDFSNSLFGFRIITAESARWMDNWPALVVPFLASTFGIFLLRQFFMQIPAELFDAAQIDGAGHVRFLFQIVLPISRAAITTVVLFTFIGTWNVLDWPILVTSTDNWRPIAYALYSFREEGGSRPNLLMAGAFIALFPVMLMYFIAQKQFTEGIATTGLKG
ncbi:MAG: carbohydrate ABC transporter permease [Chloroflexi bacterium]|nr:carbohydrate ABC transporter permease [Chloroflexota bacterium]